MSKRTLSMTEAGLLACLRNGELYGRDIRREYRRRVARAIPYGSLYTTLSRMEAKGLVKSRMGESVHSRGGNRRKYFEMTGRGVRALDAWETSMAAMVRA